MNLSFSIRRPITVTVIFIAVTLLGIFAFSNLGVNLLPNVNLPHLMVQTTYPNAMPEEVEKQITEPLESAVGTVTGVKKVTSVSKEGVSVISVDFVWGTDMKYALLSLREKLDNMSFALPKEAGRPTIIRSDPSATPIMTLTLASKRVKSEERRTKSDSNSTLNTLHSTLYIDHSSDPADIEKLITLKEAGRVVFKRRLEQIEGVAQAIITGGLEREILINADAVKLNSLDLTFDEIGLALKGANLNMPAGSIMKGLFRYSLRTLGEYKTVEDIKKTVVKKNINGSTILVEDVAEVLENFKEREGLTRFNGNESVGMLIYKQPDANTVTISQEVKETIESLKKDYPDYNLQIVSDQSGFIENAISNVKQEIFYGGILAVIVLFFFLGNIRHILIIGITIPASLIITILLLYLFDINFNIISLGGLAVGVGMLLDNAIIVIENNTRYRELGFSNRLAVIKGTKEVSMPIAASTLTTIAVFLPLIFVEGIVSELFRDNSLAIAFSLATSVVTALTLIPMLDSRESYTLIKNREKYFNGYLEIHKPINVSLLKKITWWIKLPFKILFKSFIYLFALIYIQTASLISPKMQRFFKATDKQLENLIMKYEILLEWALNNKKKVLLITGGLFLITVFALIDMKKEFIPKGAAEEFIIDIEYPAGTSLRGNAELTSKIEQAVLNTPHVSAVVSNIGRVNEFDFMNKEQISVNKTNLIVKLDSYENYYDVHASLRNTLASLKGIKYAFKDVKTSYSILINPSENDIAIKVKNKDLDKSFEKAGLIVAKINKQNIEGIKELRIGLERGTPEYTLTINREKCLANGVSVSAAANQIVSLVKGNVATYFSDFDKKIGINVRTGEQERDNLDKVLNNYVKGTNSNAQLKNLVDYKFGYNYNEIWREDQARTLYIFASLDNADIDDVISKIENVIGTIPKSHEEFITTGGVNEEIISAFSALYIALIISVLLMFMVLASEFESLVFPFVILFSVPLGLIGGVLFLYLFGESISIISLMGLIILVGIADNDAVVKVEFIMRKREEGLSVHDAIVAAGKERFRPIVMNSLTVMFGMIPMVIGIGAATQLRVSLSLAVIGGLISSTFLTLIIVPVLYSYAEKFSKKKFGK
ncbi:MAG: hydrophobic/amphiphilic exporter-1 (mainly G- bacteria) HAE1 family [Ignavibacteria bacterium]|nr:MAG: hydrophobic/amphiphilic exporter-1 (mainly G- bacteria) HAE1 family [Ignavibacteria bacterium]KAF0158299.1 MAG: hydrophobic/amphiphilic exporter-1 (mainly G- bacteria) HAE1 family [Ignavibacteria bacterium]